MVNVLLEAHGLFPLIALISKMIAKLGIGIFADDQATV
jgi:hypothetical protein